TPAGARRTEGVTSPPPTRLAPRPPPPRCLVLLNRASPLGARRTERKGRDTRGGDTADSPRAATRPTHRAQPHGQHTEGDHTADSPRAALLHGADGGRPRPRCARCRALAVPRAARVATWLSSS